MDFMIYKENAEEGQRSKKVITDNIDMML